MNFENLKNPPKKYRPAPFWSWNEKLDTEETRLQVREMEQAGLGGYFMHARGGLQTEYLSDEWYDNVLAACDEGGRLGMESWGKRLCSHGTYGNRRMVWPSDSF